MCTEKTLIRQGGHYTYREASPQTGWTLYALTRLLSDRVYTRRKEKNFIRQGGHHAHREDSYQTRWTLFAQRRLLSDKGTLGAHRRLLSDKVNTRRTEKPLLRQGGHTHRQDSYQTGCTLGARRRILSDREGTMRTEKTLIRQGGHYLHREDSYQTREH